MKDEIFLTQFYSSFLSLCKRDGMTPSAAAKKAGISSGAPTAWKNGAVEGLCAKGNFEVDITWENGSLKEATILSKAGAPCHVRYGDKTLTFKTSKGKTYKIAMENGELKTLR